ncbi:Rieske 2Fe-2S domain-containing protein [Sphingomonas tagetis]|uniref:Rieske 2Fe-2S domain-containing protein n=1 Tax=Sphingomonas tagetis TaxID=2949092 RepID=UPI00345E1161
MRGDRLGGSDAVARSRTRRKLCLFRDSAGKLGLLDEQCCRRGASLCLGRLEGDGVRFLYHGWKFDTDGTLVDMPNIRSAEKIMANYRQPSFRCARSVASCGAFSAILHTCRPSRLHVADRTGAASRCHAFHRPLQLSSGDRRGGR